MERQLVPGGFYKHFKNKLYQVKCVAYHSETKEKMVVYQAMYGEYAMYVRPYDIAQKYRFEQVDPLTMQEISDNLQSDNSQAVRVNSDNRIDEAYTLKEDSVDNSLAQPEQQVAAGDSVLDKFLDARGYEEKLDVLIRYKSRFTNPMIDIMAESLEIVVPEGELSGRIDSLRKVLQAHTKYEGSHLRP